jgi:ClpP class serine protease
MPSDGTARWICGERDSVAIGSTSNKHGQINMSEATRDQAANDSVITIGSARVPYLREYLGWWMLEERAFNASVLRARQMDIAQHMREVQQEKTAPQSGGLSGVQSTAPDDVKRRNVDADVANTYDVMRKDFEHRQEGEIRQLAAVSESYRAAVRNGYSYEVADGIAMIQIVGSLMKHVSSFDEGSSTVMLRNTVRAMSRDPNVRGAILIIDSPGGTVSGAYDLADDVAALAKKKPTYAYIEDLGASAAYLQASQTRGISRESQRPGRIDRHVWRRVRLLQDVRDGGREGDRHFQRRHEGRGRAGHGDHAGSGRRMAEGDRRLNDQFVVAVSKGRGMPKAKVQELADGRVHISAEAKKIGLIDNVESLDQLFSRVAKEVNANAGSGGAGAGAGSQQTQVESANGAVADDAGARALDSQTEAVAAEGKDTTMSKTDTPAAGSEAATMKQLREACAGASSDFLVEQSEKGATVAEAKDAFIQWQGAQIRSRDEDAAKLKKEQEEQAKQTTTQKRPGVAALESAGGKGGAAAGGGAPSGDAVADFNAAVTEQMSKPGYESNRKKAVLAVAKRDPAMHRQFLEATNPKRVQRDMLADKYDA